MRFSEQIRSYREQLGMSMKDISEKLEIPYRTWQDWEAGRREPAEWTMNLLLEKLERMVEERKMDKNLLSLASKLYDYMEHDVEGIENDWNNDYLSEYEAKGETWLWYYEESLSVAINEETEEIIEGEALEKRFGL